MQVFREVGQLLSSWLCFLGYSHVSPPCVDSVWWSVCALTALFSSIVQWRLHKVSESFILAYDPQGKEEAPLPKSPSEGFHGLSLRNVPILGQS